MKGRMCPECGLHNLENAFSCTECGTTISIKTLVDVENKTEKEAISITHPSSTQKVVDKTAPGPLSRISPCFEENVNEILNPVREYGDEAVWGCDITLTSFNYVDLFGFLIITTQKLIHVYFAPTLSESVERELRSLPQLILNLVMYRILGPFTEFVGIFQKLINRRMDVATPRRLQYRAVSQNRKVAIRELEDLRSVVMYKGFGEGPNSYYMDVHFKKSQELHNSYL